MSHDAKSDRWSEGDSRTFIAHGDLFVPRRTEQTRAILELLPGHDPLAVLELCCGAGRLAEAILAARPEATVTAIDGSPEMVRAARATNARFGSRFEGTVADLERFQPAGSYDAVVSSLALHHVPHDRKPSLYAALAGGLNPGGALLVADLVEPPGESGRRLAAATWDEAVREAATLANRPEAIELFRRDRWNHFALSDPDPLDQPAPVANELDWLRAVGLVDVDVFWLYAGHAVFGGFRSVPA